ncbi:MAG: GNAT family N-acetyltransferase [Actinomycetes bacterium]
MTPAMESARRATPADAARVITLAADLRAELAEERGGDLWRQTVRPTHLTSTDVDQAIDDPDATVLVGCLDGMVAGYALAHLAPLADGTQLAVVTELAVEPGAREVGVGEVLIETLVAWAGEKGCVGLDATALPGHRRAKNFFEAHGFTARELTMHRSLDPSGSEPRPADR